MKPGLPGSWLLLFLCFSCVFAFIPPRTLLLHKLSQNKYVTTQEIWFNQTLDHFSPYDHRQFKQRFYEFLDYFQIPVRPIFLVIGGEGPCNGIVNEYIAVLAKKFGAAVVSLEHRYYESLETENLNFLSSKQNSLNEKLNRTGVENRWFFFGGSYAGALSAWFRVKFPHLTCGSLASSAVSDAVEWGICKVYVALL